MLVHSVSITSTLHSSVAMLQTGPVSNLGNEHASWLTVADSFRCASRCSKTSTSVPPKNRPDQLGDTRARLSSPLFVLTLERFEAGTSTRRRRSLDPAATFPFSFRSSLMRWCQLLSRSLRLSLSLCSSYSLVQLIHASNKAGGPSCVTSSALSALVTARQRLLHDQCTQHHFLYRGSATSGEFQQLSCAVDRMRCPVRHTNWMKTACGEVCAARKCSHVRTVQ